MGSDLIEHLADDVWRVQNIDFPGLSTSLGEDLLAITLLLAVQVHLRRGPMKVG